MLASVMPLFIRTGRFASLHLSYIVSTALLLTGLVSVSFSPTVHAGNRPNFLLILTEDQGAQTSGLGTAGLETPAIDTIAEGGVRFDQAFVSTPVCSASKAGIYSGLYGHTNGIRQNTVDVKGPKLPGWLPNRGGTRKLYQTARIHEGLPTLIQMLELAGYYTGFSSKLHVAQNHQFPYDDWYLQTNSNGVKGLIDRATSKNQPWFLLYNVSAPHRLYEAPDRVNPDEVDVPGHLPNTPTSRREWASYLSRVEDADDLVAEAIAAVKSKGEWDNTIVMFLGDHGPAYHRGKMSPHDFGLRTPLSIAGPGINQGAVSNELVSTLDLMPTILDFAGVRVPALAHGKSLKPLLTGNSNPTGWINGEPSSSFRSYVVGEVSASKTSSAGPQERSIFDGQYRLIYREKGNQPRFVNKGTFDQNHYGAKGDNAPTYWEVVNNADQYPEAFEMLANTNNGKFRAIPPQIELYDQSIGDTHNLTDLADDPSMQATKYRLYLALRRWAIDTDDKDTSLKTRFGGARVSDNFNPFNVHNNHANNGPIVYTGKIGPLDCDPSWAQRAPGRDGGGFSLQGGVVDAPAGESPIATHDGLELMPGQGFSASIKIHLGDGKGAGLVLGHLDQDNYTSLMIANSKRKNGNDVHLLVVGNGQERESLISSEGESLSTIGWHTLETAYDASSQNLTVWVKKPNGSRYFSQSIHVPGGIALGGRFGIRSAWASSTKFDDFSAQTFDSQSLLGDYSGNAVIDGADIDLMYDAFGSSDGNHAVFNLAHPDATIDQRDVHELLIKFYLTRYGDTDLDRDVDIADLVSLGDSFNLTGGWAKGDFNGDNVVNLADLTIMGTHWGFGVDGGLDFEEALDVTGVRALLDERAGIVKPHHRSHRRASPYSVIQSVGSN